MLSDPCKQCSDKYQAKCKKTQGISSFTLFLWQFCQWSLLVNYYTSSWPKLMSLQNNIVYSLSNNLPQIQAIAVNIFITILLVQYLYYEKQENQALYTKEYKRDILMFIILVIFMVMSATFTIIGGILLSTCNQLYNDVSLVCAISSMVFACLEYIPQIVRTQKLKAAGSLSILSMVFHANGAAISFIVLIGSESSWTTWISTIAQFVMQMILLIQLSIFQCCDPFRSRNKLPSVIQQIKDIWTQVLDIFVRCCKISKSTTKQSLDNKGVYSKIDNIESNKFGEILNIPFFEKGQKKEVGKTQ